MPLCRVPTFIDPVATEPSNAERLTQLKAALRAVAAGQRPRHRPRMTLVPRVPAADHARRRASCPGRPPGTRTRRRTSTPARGSPDGSSEGAGKAAPAPDYLYLVHPRWGRVNRLMLRILERAVGA